jgi:hypothetical protein
MKVIVAKPLTEVLIAEDLPQAGEVAIAELITDTSLI